MRIADIKERHEFWSVSDICAEYMCGDLRDPLFVQDVFRLENTSERFDEVYQLAADMGGAGYIFTGKTTPM